MHTVLISFQLFFKRLFPKKLLPASKRYTYIAMGDSTVEGIGATNPERNYASLVFRAIKTKYKKARFINLGKAGATAADMENDQLEKAIAYKSKLITISIGANDIRTRVKRKQFEQELQSIIKKLSLQTQAVIVLNTIPDFSSTPAVNELKRTHKTYGKVMLWQFNEIIKKTAQTYNAILVDFSLQNQVFTKYYPETVAEDGFHPSDFGYALWANTIIARIQDEVLTSKTRFQLPFFKRSY